MKFKSLVLVLLLFILNSCANISFINNDTSSLYTPKFLQEIGSIKEAYRQGNDLLALQKLNTMKADKLMPTEKALRKNLIGVIHFSRKEYEASIKQFLVALQTSRLDGALTSQIYLNLGSSYYKLGHFREAFSTLDILDRRYLQEKERKKYFKLQFKVAMELDKDRAKIIALINLLGMHETLLEVKGNPYFSTLAPLFGNLKYREKVDILEEFEDSKNFVVGYLAFLEAEKLYYQGKKDDANKMVDWVRDNFEHPGIVSLISRFENRAANFAKMNPTLIGVVLPLSGEKEVFGKKVLYGLNQKLLDLQSQSDRPEKYKDFKIIIKDSKGSGLVGKLAVKNLIEKDSAAVIIGGLFSNEAKSEYLQAKELGTMFISLSQIFLDPEMKNHLLVEVAGSIESQIESLFTDESLRYLGKKAAIIYPNDDRGHFYAEKFWTLAKSKEIEVTDALAFTPRQTDYRSVVSNLLSLKYPREREEEVEIFSEIHKAEKRSVMRRLQTLEPVIDFDWVFIPSYPKEAMLLIPSFNYFDAFRVKLVGGPSWNTGKIVSQSYKLGKLNFVGDNFKIADDLKDRFVTNFNKSPNMIETLSYDAMGLATDLLVFTNSGGREELGFEIQKKENLKGATGEWFKKDLRWYKKMNLMSLKRGEVSLEVIPPVSEN